MNWKTIFVCPLLVILIACSSPTPATTELQPTSATDNSTTEFRILALGDSLTAGFGVSPEDSYPAQLQDQLRAEGYNVEVINGGISGETSSAALARVEWMLNTVPDIVIVETGGNDALRGIDLDLTASNIDQIVKRFTDEGAVVIVAGMQIIQNLGQEYADSFAAIYPQVASRYDAILIPFFLEGVAADPALNQADFIHPNPAGYSILVEHIYPFVLEAIRLAS
jgi:acyl-CoA thioesterase-1